MNWCYVSNKKWLLLYIALFCSVSSSDAMMQKLKNLFVKHKEEPKIEEPFLKKAKNIVHTYLEKHPDFIEKIKKNFTRSQLVCIGAALGGFIGYTCKPTSSFNAAIVLSFLLAGGQMLDLYDWSKVDLIKKVMERVGTKFVAGAIVAISFPVGFLLCESLPITMTLTGALLGNYIHTNK